MKKRLILLCTLVLLGGCTVGGGFGVGNNGAGVGISTGIGF
ncbi:MULTISPECIES: hypothetical protein [Basfia]|uniref:Lipoprotein n=2 Tax=Basfia TaxID=697331 RepID=Q65SK6_MANSM|nr:MULTISPECIES: hypothetical protein [Basfia]AAU38054.1 unknown [[Mannheimia] succiniciproducens MBEL55E]SCX99145.1 hypothetical protein SAMN02910354_01093 [Basfia succiniciproducens]SEP80351.1 hypothetical protein SAMN02910415_00447 [Basfia succiniciproducens]